MEVTVMTKKGLVTLLTVSAVFLAFCSIFMGVQAHRLETSNNALKTAQKVHQKAQSKFTRKQATINDDTVDKAAKSATIEVRTTAMTTKAIDVSNALMTNFFQVFYNWNSGSQYAARTKALGSTVSKQVLNDKTLFDAGKDNDGNSIVDALGLSSTYDDSDTMVLPVNNLKKVSGITIVSSSANYEGRAPGTVTKAYAFEINVQKQLITKVSYVTNVGKITTQDDQNDSDGDAISPALDN